MLLQRLKMLPFSGVNANLSDVVTPKTEQKQFVGYLATLQPTTTKKALNTLYGQLLSNHHWTLAQFFRPVFTTDTDKNERGSFLPLHLLILILSTSWLMNRPWKTPQFVSFTKLREVHAHAVCIRNTQTNEQLTSNEHQQLRHRCSLPALTAPLTMAPSSTFLLLHYPLTVSLLFKCSAKSPITIYP